MTPLTRQFSQTERPSYIQSAAGLAGETRSGTSKYYSADGLGTTRAITNSSQAVTDSLDTDGFGMAVVNSGSTPTPFGFAGQHGYQSDSATGLMRLGHRYYDASIGRFISRDPIQDGDNWYAYVSNDPVNKADAKGLMEGPPWGPKTITPPDPVIPIPPVTPREPQPQPDPKPSGPVIIRKPIIIIVPGDPQHGTPPALDYLSARWASDPDNRPDISGPRATETYSRSRLEISVTEFRKHLKSPAPLSAAPDFSENKKTVKYVSNIQILYVNRFGDIAGGNL